MRKNILSLLIGFATEISILIWVDLLHQPQNHVEINYALPQEVMKNKFVENL